MALTLEEKVLHEFKGIKYRIIDFNGEILWCKRDDKLYAVDPRHLELFKAVILGVQA